MSLPELRSVGKSSGQGPRPRHAELSVEQAYANWAYENLDRMLEEASNLKNMSGDAATSRAFTHRMEQRVKELRAAVADASGLIFGRLDRIDDGTWYIGRHHVDGEGDRPAVVDWRADFAKAFYQADRRFPAGIGRRRTIAMKAREVTRLSDELLIPGFVPPVLEPVVAPPPAPPRRLADRWRDRKHVASPSAPASKDAGVAESSMLLAPAVEKDAPVPPVHHDAEEPARDDVDVRAPDLLLEDLARERTGEMADIVATIQADQDRLMRAAPDVPLVIQGGPGTGKTVVGLHRAAWVLYWQRQTLAESSVLIVGPNRAFLDYIGSVLPSLGESQARQATVGDLVLDRLPSAERSSMKVLGETNRAVAKLKGDPRMAALIEAAVWSAAAPRELRFNYGLKVLRLKRDQVTGLLEQLRRQGMSYRQAQRKLRKSVPEAFSQEYVRRLGRQSWALRPDELKELMAMARRELIRSGDLDKILPSVSPTGVVQRLLEDEAMLRRFGSALSASEQELLAHRPSRRPSVTWTQSDLPLIDEAMACIRGPGTLFGHVVVDEAQDLSPMQWRVITRRTLRGSMTILGDLAQATSPWSPRTWTTVIGHAGLAGKAEVAQLRLGYRVPRQVMDFASPLLARAAPAIEVPKSFRSGIDPVLHRSPEGSLLRRAQEVATNIAGRGSVAVISPVALRGSLVEAMGDLASQVSVLTPEEAKGLEFDVVVVVEPATIAGRTKAGLRSLYICLTRATKELIVLHSKPLPIELGANQPLALPATYPNPRNDDPWDNDAVHWLLEQEGGAKWTHGVLFECLRRQPSQTAKNPTRLRTAAQFARHHGVVQRRKPHRQGTIIRLMRTDPAAPQYPSTEAERRAWLMGEGGVGG